MMRMSMASMEERSVNVEGGKRRRINM